jgi:hypothetical protein
VTALRAFVQAPWSRRLLAVECCAALLCARCVTLFPPRVYLPAVWPAGVALPPDTSDMSARSIGAMAAAVARYLPVRALCLQQALAVRWMLRRRGYRPVLCLGVGRTADARAAAAAGRAAHAWVSVGPEVVCGDGKLGDYVVVGRFV